MSLSVSQSVARIGRGGGWVFRGQARVLLGREKKGQRGRGRSGEELGRFTQSQRHLGVAVSLCPTGRTRRQRQHHANSCRENSLFCTNKTNPGFGDRCPLCEPSLGYSVGRGDSSRPQPARSANDGDIEFLQRGIRSEDGEFDGFLNFYPGTRCAFLESIHIRLLETSSRWRGGRRS